MTDSVALLLRRAGYGPTSSALADARRAGFASALTSITSSGGTDPGAQATPIPKLGLDPFASMPDPTPTQKATADAQRRQQTDVIIKWWLDRLVAARNTGFEKLMFFWHGHWATSIEKVMSPQLMLHQHVAFRGAPDFAALARAMVQEPALVYSLDGHTNTRAAPNENLGRELMELFLLGIGHYTERDVKEAGRALTGWWVNLGLEAAVFEPKAFDDKDKAILGVTGNFTARSLVDHLLRRPACPAFLARRLWFRYASSTDPLPAAVQQKMVAQFPATQLMLRAMFGTDEFLGTAGKLVKQPVEWLVGAMKQLDVRPGKLAEADYRVVLGALQDLGQLPFSPPSVGGWPSGLAWLTPSSAQIRLGLAWKLADLADPPPITIDALAGRLAIDTWSDRTYEVLKSVNGDPRLRYAIALNSPEYLVT
jgi:uncharacterized protein (DUF1800 family)